MVGVQQIDRVLEVVEETLKGRCEINQNVDQIRCKFGENSLDFRNEFAYFSINACSWHSLQLPRQIHFHKGLTKNVL